MLQNGDRTMLVRSAPSHTIDSLPRMTPAPGKSKTTPDAVSYGDTIVKQEANEANVQQLQPRMQLLESQQPCGMFQQRLMSSHSQSSVQEQL